MTPVPLVKTPVRLAGPPAVTAVGLAVKLVITGSVGLCHEVYELQAVRKASDKLSANAHKENPVTRFIVSPVTKTTKGRSVFQ
jgi:hypothetical protein